MNENNVKIERFLERLQYLLRLKKITKKELAEISRIDVTTISRWNHANDIPSEGSISKICRATGCSFEWLADGTGVPFPTNEDKIGGLGRVTSGLYPRPESIGVKPMETREGNEAVQSKTEMLLMTSLILESRTAYQPALASNIRAFYQAVLDGKKGIADRGDQTPDSDLLIMTSKILESASIFRSALVSNILAFHQAVQGEIEMSEMRDEVAALRNEIHELKEFITAKFPDQDQKREAQEG